MTSPDLKALDSGPRAALSVSWNADAIGSVGESAGSVEFRQHLTTAQSRTGAPRSSDEAEEPGSISVARPGLPSVTPHKASVRPVEENPAKPLVRPVRKTASTAPILSTAKLREFSHSETPSVGGQPAPERGERDGVLVIPSRASREPIEQPEPRPADPGRRGGPELETANRLGYAPDHHPIESSTGADQSVHPITDLIPTTSRKQQTRPSSAGSMAASEPEVLATERDGMAPDRGTLEGLPRGRGSIAPPGSDLGHEPQRTPVTPFGSEPSKRSASATPQAPGAESRSTGSAPATQSQSSQDASSQSQSAWTATWEGMPSDLREVVVRSVQASVTTAARSPATTTLRAASNGDALRSMILQPEGVVPPSWLSTDSGDGSVPESTPADKVGWPTAKAAGAASPPRSASRTEDSALRANPVWNTPAGGVLPGRSLQARDTGLPPIHSDLRRPPSPAIVVPQSAGIPMETTLLGTIQVASVTPLSETRGPDSTTNPMTPDSLPSMTTARGASESDALEAAERFEDPVTRPSPTEVSSLKALRTAGPGLSAKPDGHPQRDAFGLTAGRDQRRDGDPDSATRPSDQALPFDGHGPVERGGSEWGGSEETHPDRSLSETATARATTTEPWIGSSPLPSEPRASDRSAAEETTLRHPPTAEAPKSGTIRHIHLDTAEAQGVELQLQTVGDQLVIRTQDLLGSLEGESARWKDLQQRLEANGIVLLPIESRIPTNDLSSNTQTPSNPERHTGCYDGAMDTSGRDHSGSRSTSTPPPSRGPEAALSEADVPTGESVGADRASDSRGWWA